MGDKGQSSGKGVAGGGARYKEVTDDSIFNKSVDKWQSDISNSELSAAELYTGSSYANWNDSLRTKDGKGWEVNTDNLDNALSKFELKENIVTYRGLGRGALENMFGSAAPDIKTINDMKGSIISDKAFFSTSIDRSVAGSFTGPGYILKINVPKGKGRGAYVDPISKYSGEREFLMPRNTNLKITGVYQDSNDGYTYITADYVK